MNLFSKLSDLSLRARLIIIFITLLLWLAIANIVQIYLFVGYVREYNEMMKTITLTNSINGELKEQLDDEIREIVYGKVSFEEGSQYNLLSTMNSNLDQIEADDTQERFTEEIADVRQILATNKEYIDKLGEEIKFNLPADQRNITYEYITIITDIVDDEVQQLLHATLQVSEEAKTNIVDNIKRDIILYAIAFAAVILLAIIFAWYISGNIVKPIHRLRENANEIAQGNLTVDAVVIPSKNEIGDLCRSYNRMSNNLKDIILSVRSTNDLVMLSSKDIHQSILENRLAGEEVANATQTISMNLHEQDELVKQAVSTFDELTHKYEEILSKSVQIHRHSNKSLELANQGEIETEDLIKQRQKNEMIVKQVKNDAVDLYETVNQMDRNINLTNQITREAKLLSTVINTGKGDIDTILERIEQLAKEAELTSLQYEEKVTLVQNFAKSITEQIDIVHNELSYKNSTDKIRNSFSSINSVNSNIQLEINNFTREMQKVFDQMNDINLMIGDIEQSSKLSKSEVISIASMGEEQLATLEEVSEASYKLVEKIQKMKDNIRQFKV
ncbi:HAMP domain-containing protein [Aquibacillus halophilus]|uniref:HAMP domain-containing protein n=1 Tax=Aquibacillus halophilus TaxID=930132 RepID=A0A6A8DBN2_9BACI|nr:methyl-accepting chemotaxis protein [Aquibacillus halophilus]MRH41946.1 HAMP domain-containing protein [Aquibacillus halophilus]